MSETIELARGLVRRALERGASGAECTISEGDEFSGSVRMREVESVKEAGSRGVGLRVLKGRCTGASYTSDFSPEGLDLLVKCALELAGATTEDPFAGLPDAEACGSFPGDLQLYCADVAALDAPTRLDLARRAEAAALEADPRIGNSEGAGFESNVGLHVFANSHGFAGEYRSSYCSLSVAPVARDGESMERDYWYALSRSVAGLEAPEQIGRIAAARALRRLNPVKVETQRVPVVFEPRAARTLLDNVFEAVHGTAIYRQESFLAGKVGERVAGENVTIIDDGTLAGKFGASPFDDEGVASRRTAVIERGVLKSYLLNSYAARKLGLQTTGNASRGLTGNAGIGHGNFYLENGVQTPESIIAGIPNGFYVTELMGMGVNIVTGDYSRGASGLWIRNGELAFAVSEVTIAGNLKDMLTNITAIGSDLEFRGSIAAPTLMIGEMTVGGK